jgi:hypothetical protein
VSAVLLKASAAFLGEPAVLLNVSTALVKTSAAIWNESAFPLKTSAAVLRMPIVHLNVLWVVQDARMFSEPASADGFVAVVSRPLPAPAYI